MVRDTNSEEEVMIMNTLTWIQKWYAKHCNGDWEHFYGVKIETVDNPGWSV